LNTEPATLELAPGTLLFAHPCNPDARAVFFADLNDFYARVAKCRDVFGTPVDEFEMTLHDGTEVDAELWQAINPSQGDLATWFIDVEPLGLFGKAALFALVNIHGFSLRTALDIMEDAVVRLGTVVDHVVELIEGDGLLDGMPEDLRAYSDTESYAQDMQLNGDIRGFRFAGQDWTLDRVY